LRAQFNGFSLIGADEDRLVLTPAGPRLNSLSITFAAMKPGFAA